jgi:uncharacterized membrane protein
LIAVKGVKTELNTKTLNPLIVSTVIVLLLTPCLIGQQIPLAQAKTSPAITMQDLGSISGNGGSSGTTAASINDKGEVVGTSNGHAYIWTQKDGMKDLGLDSFYSAAFCINNKGEVTGTYLALVDERWMLQGFIWTEKDGLKTIGNIFDSVSIISGPINDKGESLWLSIDSNSDRHVYFLSDKTGMVEVGPLPPQCKGYSGLAFNNKGEVAGSLNLVPTESGNYPFIWTEKDGVTELSPLFGGLNANLYGINNKGEFVGGYRTPADQETQSYICKLGAGLTRIAPPAGNTGSQALSVNNKGQIIGTAWVDYSLRHGYYWDEKSGAILLETLPGAVYTDPSAINSKGQAVGSCAVATSASGTSSHAILWTIK